MGLIPVIESLLQLHGRFPQKAAKLLLRNCQRVRLLHGMGDKVDPARQNLPHGADLGGNPLDTVNHRPILLAENDIAVLAHQLHNQTLAPHIAHLVQMLQNKFHNPLQPRLADLHNAGASDMLAQQHTEARSR